MAYMMLWLSPFPVLIGCTREGEVNSVISGPSTRAGATAGPSLDSNSDPTTDFLYTDGLPNSSDDVPMITVTSTPTGVTVQLNWEQPSDANTVGYSIYYGKEPAEEAGSCAAYEANLAVETPPATIVGLDHETVYYFAVKHFNDSEDACSEEIMVVTPPARP